MREMKDSGIEWIGEIPVGWSLIKLKYLYNNSNVGESIDKEYCNEGDRIFYTAGINPITTSYEDFPDWKYTTAKDLLLARNGTPYVYLPLIQAIYSDHIIRIDIKDGFDKRYIRYCLQRCIESTAVETVSIATWSISLWKEQALCIPDFEEQKRLADYLDRKCSKIDEIIAKQEQIIEKLKEYKLSVITETVTRGLNPDAEMKDSGIEWIGQIPMDWELIKLKYLLDRSDFGIKVGPFGSSFTNNTVDNGDFLIYGQANVISRDFSKTKNSVTKEIYERFHSYEVIPGDICLSVIGNGTIGWCCTVPSNIRAGIMDSHLMKIRLSNRINNEFFELYYSKHFAGVCHTQMQYQKTGIAMEGLNTRIVKRLWIVVPPFSEQNEIVNRMRPFIQRIDNCIAKKQKIIDNMKKYRNSLIYEVVTGKKEV